MAEKLSPITEKLDVFNASAKKFLDKKIKSDVENENTQSPAMEIITGTQSLRDTIAVMKGSKFFFKKEEKDGGKVF